VIEKVGKSTSMLSPIETAAENPTPCADTHSTSPAAMAPDWETSARSPAGGIEAAKLALSLTPGTSTPRQLGPTRRIPTARAIVRH
jgi:hypothetical protein